MGQGAFYPTEFFAYDRKTPLPHQHLYWNIGNQKQTYLPDQSRKMKKADFGRNDPDIERYSADGYSTDDDVALGAGCMQGPDIWAERSVHDIVFLSDRLATGLRAKGMEKRFSRFVRCRIY